MPDLHGSEVPWGGLAAPTLSVNVGPNNQQAPTPNNVIMIRTYDHDKVPLAFT